MDQIHFAAALLDPRFRSHEFSFEGSQLNSKSGWEFLKNQYDHFSNFSDDEGEDELDDPFVKEFMVKKDYSEEFRSFQTSSDYNSKYYWKKDGFDFPMFKAFEFWKDNQNRYPTLSKVAFWLLSVPATSVASEKNFSDSNWMINCRRTRLDPNNVSNCLVAKSALKYTSNI